MLGWSFETCLAPGKIRNRSSPDLSPPAVLDRAPLLLCWIIVAFSELAPILCRFALPPLRTMASDRGVPGAGVYGDLPPSYTRSQPPANPDVLRRPSYCHAAFALKQISKVTQCPQCGVDFMMKAAFHSVRKKCE